VIRAFYPALLLLAASPAGADEIGLLDSEGTSVERLVADEPERAEELAALLRPGAHRVPDVARLAPILERLQTDTAPKSWWQKLKDRLAQLLRTRSESSRLPWLDEWAKRLTPAQAVRDALLWLVVIGVIVSAVVVIVRELRASGLSLRPRRRRTAGVVPRSAPGDYEPDDWRRLPFPQQPAALFRAVAFRLASEGRLPASSSHTHRELATRARLESAAERDTWQSLALVAERQLYSADVDDAEATRAVAAAANVWPDRE
jgi:hypothetical protein